MKKIIKFGSAVIAALFIATTIFGIESYAANVLEVTESSEGSGTTGAASFSGRLTNITIDAPALASKEEGAEVVTEFKAGDPVLLIGEDDNWYTIAYQGKELYISKSANANGDAAVLEATDTTALQAEFDKRAEIDKAWMESFDSQKKAIRNATIWRVAIVAIIVVLVVFIVIKGVTSKKASENK